MEEIQNPITEKARGQLYILGIVAAAVLTPIVVVMQTLGLAEWIPAVTAIGSAVGVVVGSLARSFLKLPETTTVNSFTIDPKTSEPTLLETTTTTPNPIAAGEAAVATSRRARREAEEAAHNTIG